MWNPFRRTIALPPEDEAPAPALPTLKIEDAPFVPTLGGSPVTRNVWWEGEKFPGGFGATDLLSLDYWTLRARSGELFRKNLYARGIIRRVVTNEINTGLHLEAMPVASLLEGVSADDLSEESERGYELWSDDIEARFELWASDPLSCDHRGLRSFGELQRVARRESLIDGDVLAVLMQDKRTKLPRVHLISGGAVQQPTKAMATGKLPNGNDVVHGVELDAEGRHVAYWVRIGEDERRLEAYGRTGRRIAWLIYGCDNRLDDVRGEPLLSIILQSLKEIDRFRDSTQRAAVVQSHIALWIEREEQKASSGILSAGATVRGQETITDQKGEQRTFNYAEVFPGTMIEQLRPGEKVHGFQPNAASEKFGDFETSIIYAVAWALGIPPEILTLTFQNNYSASQAAIQEYKMHLEQVRPWFADQFCTPIYQEWILSSVLAQRVDAPGLLEAWRDPMGRELFLARCNADWSGQIKPSVDAVKAVKAEILKLEHGLTTYDRATRELTGGKFARNARRMKREALLVVEARKPLQELEQTPGDAIPDDNGDGNNDREDKGDNTNARGLHVIAD